MLLAAACARAAPPAITLDPVPQRIVAGHTLRLTASASPLSAALQWYRDGIALSGATGSTLRIENVGPQHEGLYTALARGSGDALGAAWTREVLVRVDVPRPAPGVLDHRFFTPGLSGDKVNALLALDGGRVALGGEFEIVSGGRSWRNLAVLLSDGTPDPAFNPGGTGPDAPVHALVRSGGRIVAGGEFTAYNGTPCGGIAAVEGATGSLAGDWDHALGFVPGDLPVPRLHALAAMPDGSVLAGGSFSRWRTRGFGGGVEIVDRPWLVKLRPDGTLDEDFPVRAVSGGRVRALALSGDGSIVAGGSFTAPMPRFLVLEASGLPRAGFALTQAPSAEVRAVRPLPDGSFLIGGLFENVGGHLAHYLEDGTRDEGFTLRTNRDVNVLALDAEGRLLVGGLVASADGVPRRRLFRLTAGLAPDEAFRVDGLEEEVNALAVDAAGGALLVGGKFAGPHRLVLRVLGEGDPEESAPVIIRHPSALRTAKNGVLDLSVATERVSPDAVFEWTRDGVPVIRGSEPVFSIDRVGPDDEGLYRVCIEDGDDRTESEPARVSVTPLMPGTEGHHRYRGSGGGVPAGQVRTFPVAVADAFPLTRARLTVDVLHGQTEDLEVWLIAPSGFGVKVFNDGGREGRDLRHTTFDDAAGGALPVGDAFPPVTGTYFPHQPLSALAGQNSAGPWRLELRDRRTLGETDGTVLDWTLELWRAPAEVTYPRYLQAHGLADNSEGGDANLDGVPDLLAYALGLSPTLSAPAPIQVTRTPLGLVITHRRWTAPLDCAYDYEDAESDGTWQSLFPTESYLTRFPGGTEEARLLFPVVPGSGRLFRLRATVGN